MAQLESWSQVKVAGGERASPKLPSVTCNRPGGIASNLWSNLYFS